MRRPVLHCDWSQVLAADPALAPGDGSRDDHILVMVEKASGEGRDGDATPGGEMPPVTEGASRERPSGPRRTLPGTWWAGWSALVLGVLFVVVTVLVVTGVAQSLDQWVVRTVRPHDVWGEPQVRLSPWVHRLRPAVVLVLLALACVIASVRGRSWRPAVTGLVLVCVSTGLLLLVKLVVGRPDPHGALASSGGSYPSGHMAAVLVCLGGCLLVLGPGLRWWWWSVPAAGAALMAVALVVSATHWPSDVVGGALLGLAVLMTAGSVSRRRSGTPAAGAPRRGRRSPG